MAVRILIVDDHPIVRRGLRQVIEQQPDMTVAAESDSVDGALRALRGLPEPPHVAIVDLALRDASGLALVKLLEESWPTVAVLVLSMHDEALHAERALAAGARGYIMKDAATQKLTGAIRCVAAGKTYVSDDMTARMVARATGPHPAPSREPLDRLTAREREVFGLLGRGLGTRAISEACGLSVKTVETYQARIKEKLGLQTAHELVRTAVAWSGG